MITANVLIVTKDKDNITDIEADIIKLLLGNNISYAIVDINEIFDEKHFYPKAVICCMQEESVLGYLAAKVEDALIVIESTPLSDYALYLVQRVGGKVFSVTSKTREQIKDRIKLLIKDIPGKVLNTMITDYLATNTRTSEYRTLKGLQGRLKSEVYVTLARELTAKVSQK